MRSPDNIASTVFLRWSCVMGKVWRVVSDLFCLEITCEVSK